MKLAILASLPAISLGLNIPLPPWCRPGEWCQQHLNAPLQTKYEEAEAKEWAWGFPVVRLGYLRDAIKAGFLYVGADWRIDICKKSYLPNMSAQRGFKIFGQAEDLYERLYSELTVMNVTDQDELIKVLREYAGMGDLEKCIPEKRQAVRICKPKDCNEDNREQWKFTKYLQLPRRLSIEPPTAA